MFLLTNWEENGSSINELWDILQYYDDRTIITRTTSDNLSFYSIVNNKTDYINCFYLKPYNIWEIFKTKNGIVKGLRQKSISVHNCWNKNTTLIDEIDENNKLLISYNDNRPCFLIPKIISKLSSLIGCSGSTLAKPGLERDLILTKACENSVPITLISIKEGNTEKILNVLGCYYEYTNQMFLKDLYTYIKRNSNTEIKNIYWKINHFKTSLILEFNTNKDKIPCIEIVNSIAGHSSLSIEGYYKDKNIKISCFSNTQKHTNVFNIINLQPVLEKLLKELNIYSDKIIHHKRINISNTKITEV